jgi:putative DNA primase/helicase
LTQENLSPEIPGRFMARFADDYREQVRRARPTLPDALNDRAQDNWEPLLAIAGCAGNGWIERATKAALKLSSNDKTDSIGNELLADIQEVFETKNVTKISTANLIAALLEDEEKSWATYNRGKPLSPKQLVNKLKGYDIRSKTIRFGFETAKGYELDQFTDAFDRYLSYTLPLLSVTLSQTNSGNGLSDSDNESVTVTDPSKRNNATHSAKIVRI